MPAKFFICSDQEQTEIADCLKGCRLRDRCATLPYLKMISYDREYRGITPSMAGNGPRLIYLKATTDYAIKPDGRAFAALGTGVHGRLSLHSYTHNVLSEEKLSDDKIKGIADVLEQDEQDPDKYILTDYKTFGSFKVCKAIGMIKVAKEVLDEDGKPIRYKSGKKKGEIKTKNINEIHPDKIDIYETELQLNRYRMLFESYGFPISKIRVQAIIRDGGLYITQGRGIDTNLKLIPIKMLPDNEVLNYYDHLTEEVNEAHFEIDSIRKCNDWESWNGNRCNEKYCEVKQACDKMEK